MDMVSGLAAWAIRQAVAELEHAYKKVKHWDMLSQERRLGKYVKDKIKKKDLEAITFTLKDATAVDLFNEGDDANDKHYLLFGLAGIDSVPAHIREQKAFIDENLKRLKVEINTLSRKAKKEIEDQKEGII